jgi:hypothetical protein
MARRRVGALEDTFRDNFSKSQICVIRRARLRLTIFCPCRPARMRLAVANALPSVTVLRELSTREGASGAGTRDITVRKCLQSPDSVSDLLG